MKKTLCILLVVLMLLVFAFAGCSGDTAESDSSDGSADTGSSDSDFVVGYANLADSDYWCKYIMDRLVSDAEADGMTVLTGDGNCDVATQINVMENFIAKQVDAIVIVAVDSEGVVSAVEEANDAGIPVIAFNVFINGGETYVVAADNYLAGQTEAEYLADILPEDGTICYLKGTSGLKHAEERRNGFIETITELRPDAEILSELDGDFIRTEGLNITEDWIQAYGEVDAIISGNDQMALGAIEALKGAGIEGTIVMGVDGTDDALACIQEGTMYLSCGQHNDLLIEYVLKDLNLIRDGKEDEIEELLTDWNVITADNVEEYIGTN